MSNRNLVGPKNGWRLMDSELPEDIAQKLVEAGAFDYDGQWINNGSYRKGDNFIVVTDNGGFFKVNAEWMIWHLSPSGKVVAQAIWSIKALKKSVNSLMLTGETILDPGYQT